jgi:hypothetical protein
VISSPFCCRIIVTRLPLCNTIVVEFTDLNLLVSPKCLCASRLLQPSEFMYLKYFRRIFLAVPACGGG